MRAVCHVFRSRPFRPGVSRSSYGDLKFSRMAEFTVVTADSVNVIVSSNITQYPMHKRFQKGLTILQLKVTIDLPSDNAWSYVEIC